MTTITHDQMRPGQIVQRVSTQTYRVLQLSAGSPEVVLTPMTWAEGSNYAGLRKLDQLLPDRAEWQLVRGRWRVRWRPPFRLLGAHIGFWIAEEQDHGDADGEHEWRAFDTWADAIAYADRMAREGVS